MRDVIIFGELFGKVMVIKLVALAKPKSLKRTRAKINYYTSIPARNTNLSKKKKKQELEIHTSRGPISLLLYEY